MVEEFAVEKPAIEDFGNIEIKANRIYRTARLFLPSRMQTAMRRGRFATRAPAPTAVLLRGLQA
jgi:hypothetical protein